MPLRLFRGPNWISSLAQNVPSTFYENDLRVGQTHTHLCTGTQAETLQAHTQMCKYTFSCFVTFFLTLQKQKKHHLN